MDVAIMTLAQAEQLDVLRQLLMANPVMRIIGATAKRRKTTLYEMRPHRICVGHAVRVLVNEVGHARACKE